MDRMTLSLWVVALFFGMLTAEIVGGHHRRAVESPRDRLFTLTGMGFQLLVAAPIIAVVAGFALSHAFPAAAGRYAHASFWMVFPVWFTAEEFCHYWVHRWAHEHRWLWKLHRTHHSAAHINAAVTFRYNVFWTFMLPQTWFGAAAVYLGLYQVFVAGALTTFVVNLFTHTAYRWDLALRRLPGMNPVMNVVEKILTLPDTHHAHHGLGQHAYMRGNYAVTIFLFDILLGTARIPRQAQERFGLPGRFDWKEELFWPVMRSAPRRLPPA